jgi:hypothetical protein
MEGSSQGTGLSDRDALISSTRSLFDSLLKGSCTVLNNQTEIHAACEAACAAASATQNMIKNEEISFIATFEKLETLNKQYQNALAEHCTNESSILVDIEENIMALTQTLDQHRKYCLGLVDGMSQKTAQIEALEIKLCGVMQELESSRRTAAQKVSNVPNDSKNVPCMLVCFGSPLLSDCWIDRQKYIIPTRICA